MQVYAPSGLSTAFLDGRYVNVTGDTMTGALAITLATGNSLVVDTTTLVVDATNNRVGIGTAAPAHPLQVIAANNALSGQLIGAHVYFTHTPAGTSTAQPMAQLLRADIGGAVDLSGVGAYGAYYQILNVSTSTGASALNTLIGFFGDVYNFTTGTVSNLVGAQVRLVNSSTGIITNGQPLNVQSPSIAGGNITTVKGLLINKQFNTNGSSSTTGGYNSYGIDLVTGDQGGNTSGTNTNYGIRITGAGGAAGVAGTVDNYGINLTVPNGSGTNGTVNNYGVRITGNSANGDTNYALYADSTADSYMAGKLGIGTTAPKSKLHIEGASGWIIADEQDTNPTTTELDANDAIAIYTKANKLVIAYNNAGAMTYVTLDLDGSDITWAHGTSAP